MFPPTAVPEAHFSEPRLHLRLETAATGPHDVYVIRNTSNGELLHFGETGRGYMTRLAEHQRSFNRLGIDVDVELLRSLEGKAAARALESRYIDSYRRIFGKRPPFNFNDH